MSTLARHRQDVVEFTTPNASPSPLGALVEQGTTLPVSVRVGGS